MTKNGINLKTLKEQNRLSVLQAVREHGPVSRTELGRILGLSGTACIDLTRGLLAKELICEKGPGDSSGGRKPILLEINWRRCYVIGFELAGDGILCGIYDMQLTEIKTFNKKIRFTGKKLSSVIKDHVELIIHLSGIQMNCIVGMTIGVAGIVDNLKKNIISSTPIHTKEIIHIKEELNGFFPFPVYLENNCNLMALAERKLFYPGCESLALILVAEGGGGGITKGDDILRGAHGFGGEIGHMSIDRNGPPCFCGNQGCIEVLGSIPALLNRAAFALQGGRKSLIQDFKKREAVTVWAIAEAYRKNDDLAVQLFENEANVLYHAINNVIMVLDPDVIVLSGEIVLFGQPLLDRIGQEIRKSIFTSASGSRTIAFTKLENPRVQGAGMYAIESFFADPAVLS